MSKSKKSLSELAAMFARAAEAIESARESALTEAAERLGVEVVAELRARARREGEMMPGLLNALAEGVETKVEQRAVVGLGHAALPPHELSQALHLELGGHDAPGVFGPVASRHAQDIIDGLRRRLTETLAAQFESGEPRL
jgi:hypothetical protein